MSAPNFRRMVVTCVAVVGAPLGAAIGAPAVSTVDSGGRRASSAAYSLDGSVGGVGTVSEATPAAARHGYPGQLTEVVSLSVIATPDPVDETATSQLSGVATLDDASLSPLAGSDVVWTPPMFPVAFIDGSGLATTSAVSADTNGAVSGTYLGALGAGMLLVLDNHPDNFGNYAGDGLPDTWQTQFFGLDNPDAAPDVDADGDGQDNRFEHAAGLAPTDAASRFRFTIEAVPGQPAQKKLIFGPLVLVDGRTYTVKFRFDLATGPWEPLSGATQSDLGDERTVTDVNATGAQKYYQVEITRP